MAAQIELWSNVSCAAGATRLAVLADWLTCEYGESLNGDIGCTLVLPEDSLTLDTLALRQVIRVDDGDEVYEYRLVRWDDAVGTGRVTLTGVPLIQDLANFPVVTVLAGTPTFSQAATSLTPTQWIDNYVLPSLTSNGITWVSRGTVSPTYTATLSWTEITPLGVLRQLVANTDYEVYLRRNGATDYKIDLVTVDRSGGVNAVAMVGRNVKALRRSIDATQQFTVVIPQGLTQTGASIPDGVEQTAATLPADPTSQTFEVREPLTNGRLITADDSLNGLYAEWSLPAITMRNSTAYDTVSGTASGIPDSHLGKTYWRLVIDNPQDGALWLVGVEQDQEPVTLVKLNKTTLEQEKRYVVPLNWGGVSSQVYGRTVIFAPTGTAGYLLVLGNKYAAHTKFTVIDMNTGTATLGTWTGSCTGLGQGVWVGGTINKWYVNVADNAGVYEVRSVNTSATHVNTIASPSSIVAMGWAANSNYVYCGQSDASLVKLDASTNTFGTPFTPSGVTGLRYGTYWWQGSTNRLWIHGVTDGTSARRTYVWNTATDTLDTGIADYGSTYGTMPSATTLNFWADTANDRLYYFLDRYVVVYNTSTKALDTVLDPMGTGLDGTQASQYRGHGFWDDTRKLLWVPFNRCVMPMHKSAAAPQGKAVLRAQITDSAATSGSGSSLTLASGTYDYSSLKAVRGVRPALTLRATSTGGLLSEVANAAAVTAYGRIVGFLNGSTYNYRGTRNLCPNPQFDTWHQLADVSGYKGLTPDGVSASWYDPQVAASGATYTRPGRVAYADYANAATAITATANGAYTDPALTIALSGLGASRKVPAGSRIYNTGNSAQQAWVADTVTADGSGNATLTLTDPLGTSLSSGAGVTVSLACLDTSDTTGATYGACVFGSDTSVPQLGWTLPVPIISSRPVVVFRVWAAPLVVRASGGTANGSYKGSDLSIAITTSGGAWGTAAATGTHADTTVYSDGASRTYSLALAYTPTSSNPLEWLGFRVGIGASSPAWVIKRVLIALCPSGTTTAEWATYGNDLWNYGLIAVRDYGEPPVSYDCEPLEDDMAAPFALGGTVLLRDPSRGVAATPRVVGITRTATDGSTLRRPVLTLENRPASLIDALVRKGSV